MPRALINGVELEYSDVGEGFPLIWAHEFAGSMDSWDAQVGFFARRYRVITYNARGYPPSQVPQDLSAYSQDIAVADCYGLLQHLGIDQAYVGGLSMGGSLALHFGLQHPDVARALIVAAAGTGSDDNEAFRASWRQQAGRLESQGMEALREYAAGPARVQLRRKDPAGYRRFVDLLMQHSGLGSALTGLGVQVARPPIYAWEQQCRALRVPTLIMCGDEDEPCINPSVFLKRCIPSSGLVMFAQSGHAINLEEPDAFNRAVWDFLALVEAGKWAERP